MCAIFTYLYFHLYAIYSLRCIHFYFIHMGALPACMSLHYMCALCLQRPEGGVGSPHVNYT